MAGFASDKATDLSVYGLDNPRMTLTMSLLPKPGEESRPPRDGIFLQGGGRFLVCPPGRKTHRCHTGQRLHEGFADGCTGLEKKRLFSFSRFDLREMHLERIGSGGPLVLKFDRLDDSWTASKDGKDETLNINPNRANRYLDELEKMEVSAWLPYTDATAHEALKNPVFRLKLILQSYKEAPPVPTKSGTGDITFAPEPETEDKVITLEIAPAGEAGYSRFYYGRVNTTPNYFILNMDAVRLLGASLSEDN